MAARRRADDDGLPAHLYALSSGDGVYQRQAQLAEARAAPRYNAAEDEATCCARAGHDPARRPSPPPRIPPEYLSATGPAAPWRPARDKFRTPALIARVGAGALAAGGLTMLHSDTHPIYHRPVDRDRLPALIASILGGVPPWNW